MEALFSIHDDKAPGPDGFSSSFFFKKCWHIVGDDVSRAVKFYFETCAMFHGFNSTIVAIVPKRNNLKIMSGYRPISCCSVVIRLLENF